MSLIEINQARYTLILKVLLFKRHDKLVFLSLWYNIPQKPSVLLIAHTVGDDSVISIENDFLFHREELFSHQEGSFQDGKAQSGLVKQFRCHTKKKKKSPIHSLLRKIILPNYMIH